MIKVKKITRIILLLTRVTFTQNYGWCPFPQSTKPSTPEKAITTKVYLQTINDHLEDLTPTLLALVNINWGSTFDSDIPGTFESDTCGTIKVMLSFSACFIS